MPFTRKTIRRASRHVTTLSQLTKANWQVISELKRLGFWRKGLEDVDVYLVPVSFACYGWFQPDRHIYIPAVTGANLSDFLTGQHTRLTDILRHEWAHALADRHPRCVESARFRRVFGAAYDSHDPVEDYHPDLHLTRYAASMPCEDFAETFRYFLRHKGVAPMRIRKKPMILRKWEFIQWMAK